MALTRRQSFPGFHAWRAALPGLKRQGKDYVGPCPHCGGTDRFHLREGVGGRAIVGCRGCIDGVPRPERANRFGIVLRAAGLAQQSGPGTCFQPPAPVAPARKADRPREQDREENFHAMTVWSLARRPDVGSPARRYLAARHCWPGRRDIPLPESVRWLPRQRMPLGRGFPRIPHVAAGAIAFRYADARGETAAVSLEALTAEGSRLAPKRWRRTVGLRKQGTAFICGTPGGVPLVLAEGECDALAASWIHGPEAECRALGGTSGLRSWRPAPREAQTVVIEADGGPAGAVAAALAEASVRASGLAVEVRWRRPGEGDVADELARLVLSSGWPGLES